MTARFRFRLDPVRTVRVRAEESAQASLADALRAEQEAEARLAAADARAVAARRAAADARRAGGLGGAELRAQEAWIGRTTSEIGMRSLEVDRLRTDTHARREVLADASRDRQVLDRLRDRRERAHRAEQERLEQQRLDEIALVLHSRRAA
ncbi:MAG: flagellar export protein FliJ [Solirubrobacteraceae bacterium]|nr:flagellar export protein FliJ [Solirubrobacteraceae bacterium]